MGLLSTLRHRPTDKTRTDGTARSDATATGGLPAAAAPLAPTPAPPPAPAPAPPPTPGATASGQGADPTGSRVTLVQRAGAVLVALVLLTFGVLGFLNGLAYFSTEGGTVAGLSSNGLLSTISVVTAGILIVAALRSARTVSTVMLLIGAAFLLSAMANLAVLRTAFNILAFSMANVVFSLVAGVLLLTLGAYGRVSGNLPPDSPYRQTVDGAEDDGGPEPERYAATPEERAVERAMREAELAVAERRASPEQARRVAAMAQVRTRADRRRVWVECDRDAIG